MGFEDFESGGKLFWFGRVVSVEEHGGGFIVGIEKDYGVQYFYSSEKFNVGDYVKVYISLDGKNVRFEKVG